VTLAVYQDFGVAKDTSSRGALPQRASALIVTFIDSVEQLEVLLLLREQQGRVWTARDVNDVIRSSEESIATRLYSLERSGFIVAAPSSPGAYQYNPANSNDAAVEELAAAYRERRLRVTELIYSKPTRELSSFADAFIFRKKEPNG
jgi:hypothetical protein